MSRYPNRDHSRPHLRIVRPLGYTLGDTNPDAVSIFQDPTLQSPLEQGDPGMTFGPVPILAPPVIAQGAPGGPPTFSPTLSQVAFNPGGQTPDVNIPTSTTPTWLKPALIAGGVVLVLYLITQSDSLRKVARHG